MMIEKTKNEVEAKYTTENGYPFKAQVRIQHIYTFPFPDRNRRSLKVQILMNSESGLVELNWLEPPEKSFLIVILTYFFTKYLS